MEEEKKVMEQELSELFVHMEHIFGSEGCDNPFSWKSKNDSKWLLSIFREKCYVYPVIWNNCLWFEGLSTIDPDKIKYICTNGNFDYQKVMCEIREKSKTLGEDYIVFFGLNNCDKKAKVYTVPYYWLELGYEEDTNIFLCSGDKFKGDVDYIIDEMTNKLKEGVYTYEE